MSAPAAPARSLRLDLGELAGAFGDLGTFVPFVLAYVTLVGMDPGAVLLGFGAALIACGALYRTPMPVQPMKAIGATAAANAGLAAATPAAVQAAGLVTAAIWLALAASGLAQRVARWVPAGVAIGIVLGLGLALMLEGIRDMAQHWLLGAPLLVATFLLLAQRRVPVMFLLLACGLGYAWWREPGALAAIGAADAGFRLPPLGIPEIGLDALAVGALVLALPQLPLTLGNALIATVEQNNRLFPQRATTERRIATTTGLINVWSGLIGGVPMCHGAGGMAGHVQFGARSGMAPALFGALLVVVALFFSGSVGAALAAFPAPVLGVILFLAGAQLALGICRLGPGKDERFVAIATAAFGIWNVGVAFVVGLALHHALRRGLVRL